MAESLTPLEQERAEFGRSLEEIRGKSLRVIHRTGQSDLCVFFLHGGGGRACQFKHQIRALQDKVDIVAVDLLGHGDSPAPNQPNLYTVDEHLEDTYELFMKHKKSRNIIVAHCYGAIHTLRLMKRLRQEGQHTSVVGVAIIALGTNSPLPPSGAWLTKIPAFIQEWLRPLVRSSTNAKLFSAHTSPDLITFENALTDNNRMYMMRVIGADCANQENWTAWIQDGKEGIADDINITIICGREDGIFAVDNCRQVAEIFGVSEEKFHVIENAAHVSMLEQPETVTKIISELIDF